MKENLKIKLKIIKNVEHFNSEQLLNDIYELDSLFRKIELNKWEDIDLEHFLEDFLPQKFLQNNLIVESFLDDYYYCNEEYYDEENEENFEYFGDKFSNKFRMLYKKIL